MNLIYERFMKKIYRIIANFIIAICVLSVVAVLISVPYLLQEEPESLNPNILRKDFPNHLIIASRNGLVKFVYDSSIRQYKKIATIKNIVARQIVSINKEIFCYQDDTVYRINEDFVIHSYKKLGKISVIESSGQNIFLASTKEFIILNKDLEEVSRITLPIPEEKVVENIIIYNNIAYLLDNAILPIYLFCIDIKNIKVPRVIRYITMLLKWGNAYNQWLNPELGQWLICYGQLETSSEAGHFIFIDSMIDSVRPHFEKKDFIKPEEIVRKLKKATQKKEPNSFSLKKKLSKGFQQQINLYNEKFMEEDLFDNLIVEFNYLLKIPNLSEKIRWESKLENSTIELNNWLFLKEIYPDELSILTINYDCRKDNDSLMDDRHRFADGYWYYILGITPIPPTFAIISPRSSKLYQHGNCYLVQINSENKKIQFYNSLYLKNFLPIFITEHYYYVNKPVIKYKEDYLFLSPSMQINTDWTAHSTDRRIIPQLQYEEKKAKDKKMHVNLIKIVDVKDKPKVIFSKDFDEYGLDGILDILAY